MYYQRFRVGAFKFTDHSKLTISGLKPLTSICELFDLVTNLTCSLFALNQS